jgi:ABC-type molybdate transport system substrate-binding protein
VWISRRAVYLSALLAPLLTAAIGVCACGGEGARDSAQASTLVVSAASSLKVPLADFSGVGAFPSPGHGGPGDG